MTTCRSAYFCVAVCLFLLLPAVTSAQINVCPNTQWHLQSPGYAIAQNLNDVWGVSATSVYAVGNSGLILHFDGSAWTKMSSPTTKHLNAVWGSSDNNVYAVGDDATVLRFDGGSWVQLSGPSGLNDMRDVHGGGGKVFLMDVSHIYEANDTRFWEVKEYECGIQVSSPCTTIHSIWVSPQGNWCVTGTHCPHSAYPEWTTGFIEGIYCIGFDSWGAYDVWGTSENDMYVLVKSSPTDTSLGYRAFHYGGSGWEELAPPETLERITGASATEVFGITMYTNKLIFYDGITWSTTPDSPEIAPASLWGSSSADIHLVGGKYITHYDGLHYEMYGSSEIGTSELRSVWASAPDNAYAVGSAPGLFHYAGTSWSQVPEVNADLYGIWGSSETDIFAVGDSGYVYHFDGFIWSQDSVFVDRLNAVAGRSSVDIYMIGENDADGSIYRYTGSNWEVLKYFADRPRSIHLLPGYIFVGMDNGSVWRYDGMDWVEFPQVISSREIVAIWGMTPQEIWLAGRRTYLVQINGLTGQITRELYPQDINMYGAFDIWGTTATSFYVSCYNSQILFYDGAGLYADYGSPPYQKLYGIHGLDNCRVFAVGEGGTVLYLDGLADGAEITIDQLKNLNDQILITVTSEPVCGHFLVNPAHRFIEVDFEVSGTNQVLGSAQTNYKGELALCYMPERLGTDRFVPSLAGVEYSADTLTVHLQAAQVAFGGPYSVIAIPGEEKCLDVSLDLDAPGVQVDYTVTGANSVNSMTLTDDQGNASLCYQTWNAGKDTIAAMVTHEYPGTTVVSADTLVIQRRPPVMAFDSQYSNGDSISVMFTESFCVDVELEKAYPDVEVTFSIAGANPQESIVKTDNKGRASLCYRIFQLGADTVTASCAFDFLSGTRRISDQLVLVFKAEAALVVDSDFHGDCDTLTITPGDEVAVHFKRIPPWSGVTLAFRVRGANTGYELVTSGSDGKMVGHYTPATVGNDTASLGGLHYFTASLPIHLTHAMLSYDPHFQEAGDSVLVGITTELSSRFVLDPPVAGIPVMIQVRGANHTADSAVTNSSGFVDYSYPVEAAGPDTVTAAARFAFAAGDEYSSDHVSLYSYLPAISVDESVHGDLDTAITSPEGTVCAYFVINPAREGLPVDYIIRGANTGSGTVLSDTSGGIAVEYTPHYAGVDTITATTCSGITGTSPDYTAKLILTIIEGASIPVVLNMAASFIPDEVRSIEFSLDSNKKLDAPRAEFRFVSCAGGEQDTQQAMALLPGEGWCSRAGYECAEDGCLYLTILATDLYGNQEEMSVVYDVCRADRHVPLNWTSNDGVLNLRAAGDAIAADGLVMVKRDSIASAASMLHDTELEPVAGSFDVFTNATFISRPSLSVHYGDGSRPDIPTSRFDPRKVGMYKQSGSTWDYVGGQGDGASVSAKIDMPGIYSAFYNESYEVVPSATILFQNYPNPFHPSTTITFDLHADGNVELVIYNVEGKKVKSLVQGPRNAGVHEIPWNGIDANGNPVATGVYLYRLKTRETVQTKKMLLLR